MLKIGIYLGISLILFKDEFKSIDYYEVEIPLLASSTVIQPFD